MKRNEKILNETSETQKKYWKQDTENVKRKGIECKKWNFNKQISPTGKLSETFYFSAKKSEQTKVHQR